MTRAMTDMERMLAQQQRQQSMTTKDVDAVAGGRHGDVKQFSLKFSRESNHVPPQEAYRGHNNPYATVPVDDMPAVSMNFYNHRNPRGQLGGASSTGGSGVNKGWVDLLLKHMLQANFYKAFALDALDVMNTTHPNNLYYIFALRDAALWAQQCKFTRADTGQQETLIRDDKELEYVFDVLQGKIGPY
jgi:hypothetical protein